MAEYRTERLKHIGTGESFVFDVDPGVLERHKGALQWHTNHYKSDMMARDPEQIICEFECSLFPSFKGVLSVWISVSMMEVKDLTARMLLDFGCTQDFTEKALSDPGFLNQVNLCLVGITCDGARVTRAMKYVYKLVVSHFFLERCDVRDLFFRGD